MNCDMRHRGRSGCAVPVLEARREPDDIARSDFLDGRTIALDPAETRRDDQSLAKGMGVPGGSCPRFEGDVTTSYTSRRRRASNSGSMRTVPLKYSAGPFRDGCEPFRVICIDPFPPWVGTFGDCA